MLFFIRSVCTSLPTTLLFKYISCYSLSIRGRSLELRHSQFKYISCYSLSSMHRLMAVMAQAFKYISCYSLSGQPEKLSDGLSNLNTSHVILYPDCISDSPGNSIFKYISCYSLSQKVEISPSASRHLNTSHVILYQCSGLQKTLISII